MRARLYWIVSYSQQRKLFICIPRNQENREKATFRQEVQSNRTKILQLKKEGVSPAKILKLLPELTRHQISYHYYAKYYQPTKKPKKERIAEAEALVDLARRVFNYQGNFRGHDAETRRVRNAISRVGVSAVKLLMSVLVPFLGIGYSGVLYNYQHPSPYANAHTQKLFEAAKKEGLCQDGKEDRTR